MTCELCKQPKTWDGAGRKCAFPGLGEFTPDNWRCGTMDALRDAAMDADMSNRNADSSIGVIPLRYAGGHVVFTWYKERGRVSRAYVLNDDDEPSVMRLEDALDALGYPP